MDYFELSDAEKAVKDKEEVIDFVKSKIPE